MVSLSSSVGTLYLFVIIGSCAALYKDQVGKFDWHHTYIGKPTHLKFDCSTSAHLLVATEKSIIASLKAKTGDVVWRHKLLSPVDVFLQKNMALLTASGGVVRTWDVSTGYLLWEYAPPTNADKFHDLNIVEGDNSMVVVACFDTIVVALNFQSGKVEWVTQSQVAALKFVSYYQGLAYISAFTGDTVVLSSLELETGATIGTKTVSVGWSTKVSCSSFGNVLVCTDPTTHSVYHINVSGNSQFTMTNLDALGIAKPDVAHYSLKALVGGADHLDGYMFDLRTDKSTCHLLHIGKTIAVKKSVASCLSIHEFVTSSKAVTTMTSALGSGIVLEQYAKVSDSAPLRTSIKLKFDVDFVVSDQLATDHSTMVVVVTNDHKIVGVDSRGVVLWIRPEYLASIALVDMVDLPVSESDAIIEEEFSHERENVAQQLFARISSQLLQLRSSLLATIHVIQDLFVFGRVFNAEGDVDVQVAELTRDAFNLRKMIVVLSDVGKIAGMDSLQGRLIWETQLKYLDVASQTELFIRRTSAHHPLSPLACIVGKHTLTGNGYITVFNPVTGKLINGENDLGYRLKQAWLTPVLNEDYVKVLFTIDENDNVRSYPGNHSELFGNYNGKMHVFSASRSPPVVAGCIINMDAMKCLPLWNMNLEGDTLATISSKRPSEHVHSQGRVLGDRSVLYKYINPNLVAIATETNGSPTTLTVYLIDVVTGGIIFSCNHKKVKPGVFMVHSENWIVYSYWNTKVRRSEVTVLELYVAGKVRQETVFSSMAVQPSPMVLRQSYIFSGNVVSIGTTYTDRGITTRHLLFGLDQGSLMALSKQFIDPRRPLIVSHEHREEGLMPYMPELPFSMEFVVNYNKSILGLRGIHASPAGLESTSLVFAYGVDLFFTRVFPSQMFDMLKDDFDYWFISLVLVGLTLAVVVCQKLSSRKALMTAWK